MNNPPLLKNLAYDPILKNVKLIAEAWDADGLYQVGSFPANRRWAEWNGRYRDAVRGFLKGDFWESWNAAWSIAGSGDLYGDYYNEYNGHYAGYNSSVNFLTCHDGFTLYDLYSYNEKHNEANGWNNTDGSDNNRSWNCGTEGETDDPEVLKLRFRMIRNACAVLMCSRGTPMFFAGDELGNTQFGNNNAYCQDNEISWLDWGLLDKNRDLFEFFQFMIAYRKKHPAICKKLPNASCGVIGPQTYNAQAEDTTVSKDDKMFGTIFAGHNDETGEDDLVYISINAYWDEMEIKLPAVGDKMIWHLTVDTFGKEDGVYCFQEGKEPRIDGKYMMRPRSVAVFTGRLQR